MQGRDTLSIVKVDLIPFLCEAFAANKSTHKTINRIYRANRVQYYQMAKSSPWYDHDILTCQSIENEIMAKRSLGIVVEKDQDKVGQIIKKGWPLIYNYVKNADGLISIKDVFDLYAPRSKEELDKITNDEVNAWTVIAICAGMFFGKHFDGKEKGYNIAMRAMYQRLRWSDEARFCFKSLSPEELQAARAIKQRVYESTGVSRFFVTHMETEDEDMLSFHEAACLLFDAEGLSTSILENQNFRERDIDEIFAAYWIVFKNKNRSEAGKFFTLALMVKGLLSAYKSLKKQYFRHNKETLFLELDTAQQEASQAKKEMIRLKEVIKQREADNKKLSQQVKSEYNRAAAAFREQLKSTQKKCEGLEDEVRFLRSKVKELEKALFTSLPDDTVHIEPVNLEAISGVVVGGHQRWQAKMKETLPDTWRFIHTDERFEPSFIATADIVFFFTDYLSHSMYETVYNEARRRDIQIAYLHRTNEAESIREINYYLRGKVVSGQL